MTIYVRLWTQAGSNWRYNDYTLRAAAADVATATPTSTPTPQATAAELVNPAPGSTLGGTTAVFSWTAVDAANVYQLYVGTTPGGYDIRNVRTSATSTTVSGLPRGSRALYVRLWTQVGSTWRYNDYRLTSAP
jgi:hypothetical protein